MYTTCHTFGSPITGNDAFVDWFRVVVDECSRIEIEDDIVPLVPINKNFQHIPNGIFLGKNGNIQCGPIHTNANINILAKCIMSKYDDIMYNHSCEQYVERILSLDHIKKEPVGSTLGSSGEIPTSS